MSSAPSISIVTAAYNVARYIGPLLGSIQAQTIADWECIIVDDGSKDDTVAVAEKYAAADPRIRVVRQKNSGPATARNHGLSLISPSSEYVTFMDSDDLWVPRALEILRAAISENPGVIGAHALADFIDSDGRPLRPGAFAQFGRRRLGFDGTRMVRWNVSRPTNFESVIWVTPVYPPGVLMVRRKFYDQAGPFDPASEPGEDWDMLVRLSRFGDLHMVNKVILRYRRHDNNASRSIPRNARMVRYIHHKTFFSPENSAAQRITVRRGWRAWQKYKVREQFLLGLEWLAKGRIIQMLSAIVHVPIHFFRYLRGYPTRRDIPNTYL